MLPTWFIDFAAEVSILALALFLSCLSVIAALWVAIFVLRLIEAAIHHYERSE